MKKTKFVEKFVTFTPEQAKNIKTAPLDHENTKHIDDPNCDEGGFQRGLSAKKVNQIAEYAKRGIVFGPPLVADIDGVLYYVDGQHRGSGQMTAGVSFKALVVKMTWRQAMDNFIIHNSTATSAPRRHCLGISRAPSGIKIKRLARKTGVDRDSVDAVVAGLLKGISSRGANLHPGGDFDDNVLHRAEAILDLWSKGALWKADATKGEPEYWYSHQGVFKALAALSRQKERAAIADGDAYTVEDMVEDLRIVRDETPWSDRNYSTPKTSGKTHIHVTYMVEAYKEVLSAYRDREARRLRRSGRRPRVAKAVAVKV